MKMIGEILVENGLLDKNDLELALRKQAEMKQHKPIGEVMVSMNMIGIDTLLAYLDLQLKQKR